MFLKRLCFLGLQLSMCMPQTNKRMNLLYRYCMFEFAVALVIVKTVGDLIHCFNDPHAIFSHIKERIIRLVYLIFFGL